LLANVAIWTTCLAGCNAPEIQPVDVVSRPSSIGAPAAGVTTTAARNHNWGCQRIAREIADLAETIRTAKARAEAEQEEFAPTLDRTWARLSGPPGVGNAAFGDYETARKDADQLNDMLREKGCATFDVGVEAPAFLER
jgi:hypothetical protein